MKKPKVNQATCIGCGTCPALCPNTFELRGDGKAYVTNPTGHSEAEIQEAIDACPVDAISWEEE
jgi:ferredoxin